MSKKRRQTATIPTTKQSVQLSRSRLGLWVGLGLGLLILICYANSIDAGLVFDSGTIIPKDPRLRAWTATNLRNILTQGYWWPSADDTLYRPLTTFTYLLNFAVLGNAENPAGYHAVNILLHWANTWLVMALIRRLSTRVDVAVLAAAIFAVHPVNTEAVTNIVGRADLLAGFFILFAGWCYLQAADHTERKMLWLTIMGAAACFGILAKENAVMIVGFVGLYDFLWRWPLLEGKWQEKWRSAARRWGPSYLALLPPIFLFGFVRQWMSNRIPVLAVFVDNPLERSAPVQRLMTSLYVVGRYMKLLIFPRNLSGDYSFDQIPLYGAAAGWQANAFAWFSLIAVVILIITAFRLRRHQIFAWSVLFFFVMMLPTSNLLVTIGSIMAERFMYVPSIAFCTLAALGLCAIRLNNTKIRWVAAGLAIVAYGVRTVERNADWHDDVSFWKSAVYSSPRSFKTHMLYGDAIFNSPETNPESLATVDEAVKEEEIARAILEPTSQLPLARQNVWAPLYLGQYLVAKGDILKKQARLDESIQAYRESLDALTHAENIERAGNQLWREFKLRHGVPEDQIADVGMPSVYRFLGAAYEELGQWRECETAVLYMQHIAPDLPDSYQLLGGVYFNQNRYNEAAVQFLAGLLIDPQNDEWGANLGMTYNALGVRPNPIIPQATGFGLNPNSVVLRQHINEAAVLVVHIFRDAKQPERAQALRNLVIRQYGVSPDVFDNAAH